MPETISGARPPETIKVTRSHWALILCDRDPYMRKAPEHRHTRRDDPMRTQREHGRPHTRGEASGGAPPCPCLHLRLWSPGRGDSESCCVRPSISGLCCGPPSTVQLGSASGPSTLSPPTKPGPSSVQQEGASMPHLSSTKFWTTGKALPLPSSACPGSQNEDAARRDHEDRHPLQRLRGLGPEIESVLS